jgi:hypothetical protein
MTQYEKSAIIGYWRCGSSIEQICVITGVYYTVIAKLIKTYTDAI